MEIILAYALSFVGTPYIYGGKNPIRGLDCSGYVSEILKSTGVIGNSEVLSAQDIYDRLYSQHASNSISAGSVAFYGKDALHIDHVTFVINPYQAIGADGGNALCLTEADSIAQNAYVKVRLIKYRPDFLFCLKPSYVSIGLI